MKTTTFRVWLQEIWMRHKDEYAEIGQVVPEKDLAAYFQKYKYWLRREYRYQKATA
jgi:hypothetical protein